MYNKSSSLCKKVSLGQIIFTVEHALIHTKSLEKKEIRLEIFIFDFNEAFQKVNKTKMLEHMNELIDLTQM